MKITKKIVEPEWVDYPEQEGVKFKIRQFPITSVAFLSSEKQNMHDFAWERFNYIVVDWEGIVDDDDKPLECNEENKRFIFDWYIEIMTWVSQYSTDASLELKKKLT